MRNLQSAVVVVSPTLTTSARRRRHLVPGPHAAVGGTTAVAGESTVIDLVVTVAADVPTGAYDGSIRCLATTGMVPVRITIREPSEW